MNQPRPSARSLRPHRDYRALMRDPLRRYARHDGFVLWALSRTVSGCILGAHVPCAFADVTIDIFEKSLAGACPGIRQVAIDARRVTTIDEGVFPALMRYAKTRACDVLRHGGRCAVIVGSDPMHALVAGFIPIALGHALECRIFGDPSEALAWAGIDAHDARAVGGLAAGTNDDALLDEVRERLADTVRAPAIERIAGGLGMSARSLQRRLAAAGTSFRAEVTRAKHRRAKALLATTDLKVDAVARQAGFASAGNLAKSFRGWTAANPTEYRRRVVAPMRVQVA